jgi:hypothetical protein
MPRHFAASLHADTASAIASETRYAVTGHDFFRYLKGIKVQDATLYLKVILDCEYSRRTNQYGRIVLITEAGFLNEDGSKCDLEIWTINLILGDTGFKFGVRFKWDTDKNGNPRMFVN